MVAISFWETYLLPIGARPVDMYLQRDVLRQKSQVEQSDLVLTK